MIRKSQRKTDFMAWDAPQFIECFFIVCKDQGSVPSNIHTKCAGTCPKSQYLEDRQKESQFKVILGYIVSSKFM